MSILSAIGYYGATVATLVRGVHHLPATAWRLATSGRRGAPILIRLSSGEVFAVRRALDLWVLGEVALGGEYERMGPSVQPGWTVVDIGAAHGEFAIPAARAARPGGRVVAVEPAPDTLALLRENIERNQVPSVQVVQAAVGTADGTTRLFTSPRGAMMNATAGGAAGRTHVHVPMVTLGTLLDHAAVRSCDYLKMDCEGGEYDILLSASDETLCRIRRICLEYHGGVGHEPASLAARLHSAGFDVRTRDHPAAPGQGWLYAEQRGLDS